MTSNTGLLRHWKIKNKNPNTAVTRCWLLTYAECCHAHFSVTRTSGTATTAHRHSHSEIASKNAKWMHSQCGTKAVALMFVCWNCFKRPLNNEPKNSSTQSKDLPPHQVLTAVKDAVCGSKWRMERQPVVPTDLKIWKSMTLKCLRS